MPTYTGNIYEISDAIKRETVEKEIETLFSSVNVEELPSRYGYLFEVIKLLPAESKIEYLKPLQNHLGALVFSVQIGIKKGVIKSKDSVQFYLGNDWNAYSRILKIDSLNIVNPDKFTMDLKILDKWGLGEKTITINEVTNAGMSQFNLV